MTKIYDNQSLAQLLGVRSFEIEEWRAGGHGLTYTVLPDNSIVYTQKQVDAFLAAHHWPRPKGVDIVGTCPQPECQADEENRG